MGRLDFFADFLGLQRDLLAGVAGSSRVGKKMRQLGRLLFAGFASKEGEENVQGGGVVGWALGYERMGWVGLKGKESGLRVDLGCWKFSR
ncbi:hypothetical protein KY290_005009 [Solanum tuberosum]|uniref:Uncharacterized protein n=1 Tax=Solanum tuberosum TaxID=4113 RepID=A0ABQ7WCV7_SOLTU|nr:hypothetical protein KY284_005118 [Solanum tuberosum]KAH0722329.1 hypothetical protein KY289_005373 [Solanum tuberosum]KAH0778582.1 hypothetical protein KY290_005009 [Solanum tuberosum]